MKPKKFTCYDLFVNFISLMTFLFDIGTDILVVVEFYDKGQIVWGSLSVVFIALPAVVMQFFSIKWYHNDGDLTILTVLPHLFLVGPVFRYLGIIKLGLQARQKNGDICHATNRVFSQQNDICILRLIEAFLESAPQLGLHLYIVMTTLSIDWLTGISVVMSLISLSWALTAYTDALRLAYQVGYTRRWIALFVHSLWHTCMTTARIMALVLFATVFKAWIFLVAGTHWFVMTVVISVQGIDFGDGCIETSLFRLVAGFIHIFCFLNVKDGPTKGRMTAFYCLIFVENATLWVLWYIYTDVAELVLVTAVIVFGSFVLGLLFLMVYYRYLHPCTPTRYSTAKPTRCQPTIVRRQGTLTHERQDVFKTSDSILDHNQSRNTMIDLSLGSPDPIGSPFIHSNSNTPYPRSATDRNLMAIWESSSQLNHNSATVDSKFKISKTKDEEYSIIFNEGTDGLMFRIKSQKDLRQGDCSPYSVTNVSLLNSKPGSLSPLDAHKLWEESKRRLSNSPFSSQSSDFTVCKFDFEKPDRTNSRSSFSSTSSSLFFNDHNVTVRETQPPQDNASIYAFTSHPVVIKSPLHRYDQPIIAATILRGSILKLNNPHNCSIPFYKQEQNLPEISSEMGHEDPIGSFRNQVSDTHNSYTRKPISFTKYLNEAEPTTQTYPNTDINFDNESARQASSIYSPNSPDSISNRNTNYHVNSYSPNGSRSSISSPKGIDDPPFYINHSVLSGNSCCSPGFPFIDETCSETESSSSSVKPPCDPIVCYMSAVTQLADEEVAETMQYGEDSKVDLGIDVCSSDLNKPSCNYSVSREQVTSPKNPIQILEYRPQELNSLKENFVMSPPSYVKACQRSKVLSFINGRSHPGSNINNGVVNQGSGLSCLSTSSQKLKDTPWRLDYLNIEPSPSLSCDIKQQVEQESIYAQQSTKYSNFRLNVSDPGTTPLKLQHFEDSPAKFGRNIDLFRKGDWNSLNVESGRPLSGNFQLLDMEESPYSHHYLEDVQEQQELNDKENSAVNQNDLSPPLKSSCLQTSLARKRSISRRNSQKQQNNNGSHYVKAQPTGSKFSSIKRHSDYVQYGKTAKEWEINGPHYNRSHCGNKTPLKLTDTGCCNDSFTSSSRQPFKSLENTFRFPSSSNHQLDKDFNSRFSVTPQKAISLNIISDDPIHTKQSMRKWAPANLCNLTPDVKSKIRKKSSTANQSNQPNYHIFKAKSLEHLY